jgi:NAD(P)-dependent dehydrogenase (short-subunit alcohol dehydrogenase family)
MVLKDRIAVVFGAGGRVGGAVARAFAAEGAAVFLAGRTVPPLDAVAADIATAGGRAHAAAVDALDERAVEEHADAVVREAGRIDVVFNAIGHGDVHGTPLVDMPFEDFFAPVRAAVRSQFLIARAVARHMLPRGAGVLMAITAATARMALPQVGGTGVAFDALESVCRQLASELGPHGIRVLWVQTTGIPEAIAHIDAFPDYGTGAPLTRDGLIEWLEGKTMLKRLTSLADVGAAAAFLASDRAAAITGTGVNLTLGSVPG